MDKGINLQIEEFKTSIAKLINESSMPVSLVEMVLNGILQEVHVIKVQQVEKEKQEYDKSQHEKSEEIK